jgi:transcriptional regulator with XRE-family HTH domain
MPRRSDIIEQLRRAIRESGKSQLSIAQETGIDQPNLSKFLRGERSMSLETAAAICEYPTTIVSCPRCGVRQVVKRLLHPQNLN